MIDTHLIKPIKEDNTSEKISLISFILSGAFFGLAATPADMMKQLLMSISTQQQMDLGAIEKNIEQVEKNILEPSLTSTEKKDLQKKLQEQIQNKETLLQQKKPTYTKDVAEEFVKRATVASQSSFKEKPLRFFIMRLPIVENSR